MQVSQSTVRVRHHGWICLCRTFTQYLIRTQGVRTIWRSTVLNFPLVSVYLQAGTTQEKCANYSESIIQSNKTNSLTSSYVPPPFLMSWKRRVELRSATVQPALSTCKIRLVSESNINPSD
jgi:hypothetical protein